MQFAVIFFSQVVYCLVHGFLTGASVEEKFVNLRGFRPNLAMYILYEMWFRLPILQGVNTRPIQKSGNFKLKSSDFAFLPYHDENCKNYCSDYDVKAFRAREKIQTS